MYVFEEAYKQLELIRKLFDMTGSQESDEQLFIAMLNASAA